MLAFSSYRRLVQRLKIRGIVFGIPSGILAAAGSAFGWISIYPSMFEPPVDALSAPLVLGLVDPIIACITSNFLFSVLGYQGGASLGRSLWKFRNPVIAEQFNSVSCSFNCSETF